MATTVKIIFDRRKQSSKTQAGTVEIEVVSNGKRKRISTGIKVYQNEWNNGKIIKRIDAIALNRQLEEKYNEIIELTSQPNFTINLLGSKQRKTSFCDWVDEQIAKRTDLTERTRASHYAMNEKLRQTGYIKTFKDLSPENIRKWDAYAHTRCSQQTAVYDYHKKIKVYIKEAKLQGLINSDPYDFVKILKGKSEGIKYITEEERSRIEALELDGYMEIARDMFIFACYTGLADCDLRKITRDDVIEEDGQKFIVDKRQKTGVNYRLVILPKALEILERYDYNLDRLTNQRCNIMLKTIGAMAGVKTKLTMHVGRHTFATWALKRGVPIEIVSKMLAHSDIVMTQIYAKVLQSEVTKGFDLLK